MQNVENSWRLLMNLCPCGSGVNADTCCLPIINGTSPAKTAEALMRARYTAHTMKQYDFLTTSTHPEFRNDSSVEEIEKWSSHMSWQSLEILATKDGLENNETGEVNFRANYTLQNAPQTLSEEAFFRKENGEWFYVEGNVLGKTPLRRESVKIGRNDVCPCGSTKKFKKCCMNTEKA